MNAPRPLAPAIVALLLISSPVHARLGETEAQSQARYGMPTPEMIGPREKPLLPGATELAYHFEGWRIRAAFVAGVTVRIEYVHLPENNRPKPITEEELRAILEGEKARYTWREQKPRTGYQELNALKTALEGRHWERSDHARATFKAGLVVVLETRDADDLEKKLGRSSGPARKPATPGTPTVPKF